MRKKQFFEKISQQSRDLVADTVKNHLDDFIQNYKPKQPDEYLSRNDVAKLFGVHVTTISAWQKNKTLIPRGIGRRVFFLRSEIEASLKPLNV